MWRNLNWLVLGLAMSPVGCMPIDPNGAATPDELGESQQAVLTPNGMPVNGLPSNGMPSNGLPVNGLPVNGLPSNGMPSNGLPSNGLPVNGMPSNGMPTNGMPVNGLYVYNVTASQILTPAFNDWMSTNAYAPALMKYIAKCALRPDQAIDITYCPGGWIADSMGSGSGSGSTTDYSGSGSGSGSTVQTYHCNSAVARSFSGQLAMAPHWANGPIGTNGLPRWYASRNIATDTAAQEWVSACVASLVNNYSTHVEVSMRGPLCSLKPGYQTDVAYGPTPAGAAEVSGYPMREGAFWGNIFTSTPKINVCYSQNVTPDKGPAQNVGRNCVMGSCGSLFNVVGDCTSVCQITSDGNFNNCTANGVTSHRAVTMFDHQRQPVYRAIMPNGLHYYANTKEEAIDNAKKDAYGNPMVENSGNPVFYTQSARDPVGQICINSSCQTISWYQGYGAVSQDGTKHQLVNSYLPPSGWGYDRTVGQLSPNSYIGTNADYQHPGGTTIYMFTNSTSGDGIYTTDTSLANYTSLTNSGYTYRGQLYGYSTPNGIPLGALSPPSYTPAYYLQNNMYATAACVTVNQGSYQTDANY